MMFAIFVMMVLIPIFVMGIVSFHIYKVCRETNISFKEYIKAAINPRNYNVYRKPYR